MTDLPIPIEALDDCGAILGRRGAGKSATKTLFFEHELDRGRRCCLIDPKGDGWGIRLDPNGSPSRFDNVPIFGGAHGDLALEDWMGEKLGHLVATHDLSCVVDLSSFSVAGMRRFMRDFAEALFAGNRAPLTLFVDEADQLAPQRLPADMAMLLHHMESLIRQGRQRGIFMWMLTQRPQILNKNLLSQAETLIAMKMTTPHDRKAIREWMDAYDPEQAKEVEANLAKLGVGEAFVWVPAADFLERVQFPLFSTFDSSRTPRHGETIADISLAPIDLGAIRDALGEEVDQSAGDSPKLVHSGEQTAKCANCIEKDRQIDKLIRRNAALYQELEKTSASLERLTIAADRARAALQIESSPGDQPSEGGGHVDRSAARAIPHHKGPGEGKASGPSDLNAAARKMLDMLNRIAPARVTWTSLAAMVGNKARGGNFNSARKAMRESGLIVEDGDTVTSVTASASGMTRAEAILLWKSVLSNPAPRMIEGLASAGPLSKSDLAAVLGIVPRGGNFNNGVAQLIRNGVAVDRGGVLHLAEPLPGESA